MTYKPGIQLNSNDALEQPEVIQSPPRVVTGINASEEWFNAGYDRQQVCDAISSHYLPSIEHFVQSERRQYALAGLQQRRTQMTAPGLSLDYTRNTGAEEIRYTMFPESAPPEVFGGILQDYCYGGYVIFRSHQQSTKATKPSPGGTIRLPGFWLNGQLMLDNSHPGQPWAPSILLTEAHTFVGQTPLFMHDVGGVLTSDPPPIEAALSNIEINIITGATNINMWSTDNFFFGTCTLGPVVSTPTTPDVPANVITSDIRMNGATIAKVMSPFFDIMNFPIGQIPIIVVRIGSEALKQHSITDNRNPFTPLLNKISPPRADKLLPAYLPFAIPSLNDINDPFWDSDFLNTLNWRKDYWLLEQWLALGLNLEELTDKTPPAPALVSYIDIPLSRLSSSGVNVFDVVSGSQNGQIASWDIHAEFYSRGAIRPVAQSAHFAGGSLIRTNDKPRYWAGNAGEAGESTVVDLTSTESGDEIDIDSDVAIPDPKTVPAN